MIRPIPTIVRVFKREFHAGWFCLLAFLAANDFAAGQGRWSFVAPEERTITVRDPALLPRARIPDIPPPPTVSDPQPDAPERRLSLDEAIRVALENSEVVRVFTGLSAASSGRTIYDTAITHTTIEQEKARFDPTVQALNSFDRIESPQAGFDPGDPSGASIDGTRTDDYRLDFGLSKTTRLGGTAALNVNTNPTYLRPGLLPLNPQNRSSVDLSYTQPLLEGGGRAVNQVPIVLARINTERSYFQFKESVQELVRGVIDAYWSLVFARTDVWARRQQVAQGQEAFDRATGRKKWGLGTAGEVAQTRLALANFRASLITAEASLLDREAALRNVLGWSPSEPGRLVPVTPPATERMEFAWDGIVRLAEERRPDLIELKLIIEADEQSLLQARNQALPRADAVMLYRWNGLEGEAPTRTHLSTHAGQFTDWTLGVNFSVPLGLRQARAGLRRQELIIARDRANLQQGLHSTTHDLAAVARNLAQYYEQYEAFQETREAAQLNLEQQMAEDRAGRAIFLDVLQAITSWGNAISSEAQAVTRYNAELARLERETGTILETHGVRFVEERFRSVGPLGRAFAGECYPSRLRPQPNKDRYPSSDEPSENSFHLQEPLRRAESLERPPQPPARPAPLSVPPQ